MSRTQAVLTNMCMLCREGEILVLDKKSPSYPGITFPGGHVESGESLTDAIIREVYEETGLTIRNPRFCGIYHWMTEDSTRYLIFLYRAQDFSGTLRASAEGPVFWIPEEEFLQQPLAQGMETVFRMMHDPSVSECFWHRESDQEYLF